MTISLAITLFVTQVAAPADLDAVAAAPKNHVVLLENDEVRVLQVSVAPGETEAIHEHRWPSVIHIQSWQPAEDVRYAVQAGKLVEVSRTALPAGAPPPAIWSPREEPHAVTNKGSAPFRLLRVELKRPAR
jgi:predicted metal-dependent enzyme (double-stranded beta helix superfamily)